MIESSQRPVDQTPVSYEQAEDYCAQFLEAIQAAGLGPPDEIIADGEIHRFASNGKRGDDAGWYVMFDGALPAGRFGCWRMGIDVPWRAELGRGLTDAEREVRRITLAEARRARDAENAKRQAQAAAEAKKIWDAARPAPHDHPYLVSKRVEPHGIREHEDGKLIVPVCIGKDFRSLQFIDQSGDKRFLKFGQVKGGYFAIGTASGAKAACIVEGYATGATIHEATGYPVTVAFNAGNLQPVVKALYERYPDMPLIVCGDDDADMEGNPGRSAATEAAQSVGARLTFPERLDGVTDFNDMSKCCGLDAVRAAVDAAQTCEPPELVPARIAEEWPELISLDTPGLAAAEAFLAARVG